VHLGDLDSVLAYRAFVPRAETYIAKRQAFP
jgi:hypothetical protein